MPSVTQIIRRRRNRKQRQARETRRSNAWSSLVFGGTALIILIPILGVLGLSAFLYLRAVTHMPSPADTIYLDPIVAETNFYDSTGENLLYSLSDPLGDNRQWLTIEMLPEAVIEATIQMEDPDFIETGGINISLTLNRLWRYGLGQAISRDTSLAGRLATNTLVPSARNSGLDSNLLHLVFSAEVQRQFTPRRVLEWYLNTAFYGNDAYGIDAAAQVYFGKSARELSLDEAAMLAAIPLAPQFNPVDNEQAARDRQLNLLRDMRAFDIITVDEFEAVAPIRTAIRTDLAQPPYIASEFSIYAREQTEAILDSLDMDGARLVSRGGLRVTTTLDLDLYYQAECILRSHLAQLRGRSSSEILTLNAEPCVGNAYLADVLGVNPTSLPNEGAIMILDVRTGEIHAMIGDATSYTQQPGPTLYPFVYLTGFFGNYTPARMVLDIPTQFAGATEGTIFAPVSADGRYNGPMNLRDAMAGGLRIPAISVANSEGMNDIIRNSRTLGLNSLADLNQFDLSLIDSGGEVSVLDMTYAYSVFASMGSLQGVNLTPIADGYRTRNPVAIQRIEDADGTILWDYTPDLIAVSTTPIVDDEFAYLINDILSDSNTRNSMLNIPSDVFDIGRPVGISTGLTGDTTDSWTIGYTPQLVVGVHVGRADDGRMSLDNYGLQGATPIWQAISRLAHERYNHQPATWSRPAGIVERSICDMSGLLPSTNGDCPRHNEIFHSSIVPTQEDIYWQTVEVSSQTGLLASSSTPDYLVVEQRYFIPPSSALEWWQTNNQVLPPTDYDTSVPLALSDTLIFAPQELDYLRGEVEIFGSVNVDNLQFYQVRYGEGIRPTEWIIIGEPQTTFTDNVSLGTWDTSGLSGSYTVQISVQNTDGSIDSAGVNVIVDNIAPSIDLTVGENNELIYRWPSQTVIPLEAVADDNLAIDRIEFYNNGFLLGEVTEAPYEWIFTIERVGIEQFSATVFDEAGNQASAEIEIEVIRSGG
ncbi:MAG: PBP1A family penicillin-binding protein [Phototrophicaceae bacterium]